MNFHIFKIRCITNLHVGSGDINYNVVDKEVEKDITGLPMIHASGIKGALLKHFKDQKMDENLINYIFGAKGNGGGSNPGAYRFMDARLLARPMRADKGSSPCVNVTSESMLQDFLNDIADFGGKAVKVKVPDLDFGHDNGRKEFLAISSDIGVEGCATGTLTPENKTEAKWIGNLIGENFAFAQDMNAYDLPIIARNYLENGKSSNLWYEEFVPRGSVFYMVILTPTDVCELNFKDQVIQIGGNASVGYGFTKIEEIAYGALQA